MINFQTLEGRLETRSTVLGHYRVCSTFRSFWDGFEMPLSPFEYGKWTVFIDFLCRCCINDRRETAFKGTYLYGHLMFDANNENWIPLRSHLNATKVTQQRDVRKYWITNLFGYRKSLRPFAKYNSVAFAAFVAHAVQKNDCPGDIVRKSQSEGEGRCRAATSKTAAAPPSTAKNNSQETVGLFV